jgi:hypothetical protein
MDRSTQRAIQLLDGIARQRGEPAVVVLSPDYLRDIERVERLAGNRSGADKSRVESAQRQFLAAYRGARRAR